VGSRTQPAGLPGMRPASLARAGAQAPRPDGRGTPLSPTKRFGAAHLHNGSEQPPLKPVHALVYSPAVQAAARRAAGRADLCARAAHRRGGHRKASRALCHLAGPHHTACARQWRRRMHHQLWSGVRPVPARRRVQLVGWGRRHKPPRWAAAARWGRAARGGGAGRRTAAAVVAEGGGGGGACACPRRVSRGKPHNRPRPSSVF